VVIMLNTWAKACRFHRTFTTCLLFQTGVFLLWLSCSLDFFHVFLMAVESAPIRTTLFLCLGLGLASECIGLCTPKAKFKHCFILQCLQCYQKGHSRQEFPSKFEIPPHILLSTTPSNVENPPNFSISSKSLSVNK